MTRFGYVVLTYFTVMGVAAAAIVPTSLKLVWNVSASAPIGASQAPIARNCATRQRS